MSNLETFVLIRADIRLRMGPPADEINQVVHRKVIKNPLGTGAGRFETCHG